VSAHKAAHPVHALPEGNASGRGWDEHDETDRAMRDVITRGRRFIDRGLPVLILGETGTGKELVARALHAYSVRRAGRADAPLVTLNCASIPDTLIESELFGYARGAFSGALATGLKGKLASAHGGTLFLDEIGDMPAAQQTRLLRALSEREITPLGATQPVSVDFQLICATHQDLHVLVDAGAFRADLYYRIAVGVLRLPPLRERTDLRTLVARIAAQEAGGPVTLSQAAWACVEACTWPGNVRQLRAVLRYACALARGAHIDADDLPHDLLRAGTHPGTHPGMQRDADRDAHQGAPRTSAQPSSGHRTAAGPRGAQRERVLRVLAQTRWNVSVAARDLGICRSTLYRQLKSLGIPHIRDAGAALLDADPDAGAAIVA
jgi:transcriptional regulator of acetoin/glycerol metabolism